MSFLKYVVVELDRAPGLEMPVVFASAIEHASMRAADRKILSAGFCEQNEDGRFTAFGESDSLQMGSRPVEDGELITNFFRLKMPAALKE